MLTCNLGFKHLLNPNCEYRPFRLCCHPEDKELCLADGRPRLCQQLTGQYQYVNVADCKCCYVLLPAWEHSSRIPDPSAASREKG